MFFPKCPSCGSDDVESVEDDGIGYGNRHMGRFASGHVTGHAHPLLGIAAAAISIGRQIYMRVPGGGEKRCKHCGSTFR